MTKLPYEAPRVTVLGEVADLTQQSKPGIYFDLGNASEGQTAPPSPGTPGTGTS